MPCTHLFLKNTKGLQIDSFNNPCIFLWCVLLVFDAILLIFYIGALITITAILAIEEKRGIGTPSRKINEQRAIAVLTLNAMKTQFASCTRK